MNSFWFSKLGVWLCRHLGHRWEGWPSVGLLSCNRCGEFRRLSYPPRRN